MHKRFKKNIKNLKMLKKGDKISYKISKKPEDIFLKIMLEGMPYKKSNKGKKVISEFLDILSEKFIKEIFSGKWPKFKVNEKTLYPLFNFPYSEIEAYLKMKKIDFSGDFKTNELLLKVMKNRPGAMFSLSKWWYDKDN